jgi:tetratricopeptide (TPR) repeat protein
MKHKISSLLCLSVIFLSTVFYITLCGYSDEPQRYDQTNIDELFKQIKQHLSTHDFESVVQLLPDKLLFEIISETDENNDLSLVKAYCLIMLERKNEASEMMEKLVALHKDRAFLFVDKGLVDCINDNYGKASISFTKAIELNESVEVTFFCYIQRVNIYAARRMHKEAENDLVLMQEMRRKFPQIIPPTQSPVEFMIGKYLAEPQGKVMYRVKKLPDDLSEPSLGVYWWCCNLPEETKNELVRLYGISALPYGIKEVPSEYLQKNNTMLLSNGYSCPENEASNGETDQN